ncbi:uncharacterized protein LOC123313172 [Coccinella septempunctata]|uniref:uncharacterized protein LOC123313172 n=1 Tax=Coccinella septempunctata TaxID=41139 RepID=UPI001D05FA01|nr:uncharacterized protein LOC123313172 [Coccinella septempunctata]
MWKYSEAHLLCNKFEFGVPLEDLCPSNYLHPKIKMMYHQALESFKNSNTTLEILLSSENGSPQERIDMKENLLNFKHTLLDGSPQSYIWLIEHFLGLLPIPLLATYINGYNFNWFYLSEECRGIFYDRSYRRKVINFDYCDRHLHNEIAKLPPQHKLLLNEHIEFMRSISFIDERRRKRSVIYYCKYFTSSLLIRPFRSGLNDNSEKDYHSLIIYLVLRWPFISKILVESSLTTISEISQTLSSEKTLITNQDKKKLKMRRTLCTSQRSLYSTGSRKKQTSSSVSSILLDSVLEISEEASSISKSSIIRPMNNGNTTDEDKGKKDPITETTEVEVIRTEMPKNRYLKNNESRILKETTDEKQPAVECSVEEKHKENKLVSEGDPLNSAIASEQVVKEILPEKDDSELKLNRDSPSKAEFTENITINSKILNRISKVGWTYTPPKNTENQPNDHLLTINSISDDESTNQDLIKDSQSESTLKKYPSVKTLKSRLSFLRIGKKKSSNKLVKTNFKYTKINC